RSRPARSSPRRSSGSPRTTPSWLWSRTPFPARFPGPAPPKAGPTPARIPPPTVSPPHNPARRSPATPGARLPAPEGATMTATDTRPLPPVPTFPFSMFDPVHLGRDEYGEPVYVNLAERNILLGGEPGAGKSSGLNLIVAHGALSHDCKLILVDGKQVELGLWRACAGEFIRPSIHHPPQGVRALPGIPDPPC